MCADNVHKQIYCIFGNAARKPCDISFTDINSNINLLTKKKGTDKIYWQGDENKRVSIIHQ